jgi:uncharacterized protein involved in response to NO
MGWRAEQALSSAAMRRNHSRGARSSAGADHRRHPLRVLLSYGFRPFFLAAALWAATAIGLWIAMLSAGFTIPTRFDPLTWHIHEMLFGFVLAAIAGFLLTAMANWTGRPPVSGALLGTLLGLWLLGRMASLTSQYAPVGLAIAADLLFPLALATVVAREIIAANNRRNIPIIAPVFVLAVADLLVDLGLDGFATLSAYGWRLALVASLILISVMGGRIIPSFTRNWLVGRGVSRLPGPKGLIDLGALGVLHGALIAWVFFPLTRPTGVALLAAAALNLWRWLGWRGIATRSEALLAILHVGYGWLVLGIAALGLSSLDIAFPLSAAIHTLTVGAIGTMILAVMTRVSRGHTGRELSADDVTTLIYALVVLAAAVRIAAALVADARGGLLLGAAALWIGAFGLFALRYGPFLLRATLHHQPRGEPHAGR